MSMSTSTSGTPTSTMASGSRKRKVIRRRIVQRNTQDLVWDLTKGKVEAKLQLSEPYRLFLSPVLHEIDTHTDPSTLSFAELLDHTLGDLTGSLHINFIIELKWLVAQYHLTGQWGKNMTLLYSNCINIDIENRSSELDNKYNIPNLQHVQITKEKGYGYQHSKVSMFAYADGSLRVVVMSANLREEDWNRYTQGIWVSPKFPLKEENRSGGDSPTNFKKDILRYLKYYNQESLCEWIEKVEKVDFSEANVFFIPSVPGKHKKPLWGHLYLKRILKKHASLPYRVPSEWPIIGQCSKIGYLGTSGKKWLTSEFVRSLSASTYSDTSKTDKNHIPFHLIYPSVRNVLTSWDRGLGGRCLRYNKRVHLKQLWLKKYMRLWRSYSQMRTMAMPQIQTYCRISSCYTDMSWFMLTTANLSTAAWGKKLIRKSKNSSHYIQAYEAGVLLLPKFVTRTDTFCIDENEEENASTPYFSLPYDLPITKYSKSDVPWNAEPTI